MKVVITIECDNEAFKPKAKKEVRRILNELNKLCFMNLRIIGYLPLLDINGNKVGTFEVIE